MSSRSTRPSGSSPSAVSVDYVADAIVALTNAPESVDRTYRLTAASAMTIAELLQLACTNLGPRRRRSPALA